jgi:adhesin transport system outer membrane protein
VAENDLQALTQTPVQAVGAIPSSITQLPASTDIEALALGQSTDMRLKAERVALARSDVDREKVATMPTVYLQGDRFFNQTGSAANMVMGLTIEASIDGLGFASKGRGEAAGARLLAAQEDLRATRMEVVRTVRSLLANRDLQQGLLDGQNLSVTELKELLASYQRQYQAGSKAWMDVLNMQRELTEQRLQAAQAESDWLIYTLKLAALTGQLDALALSKD